MGRLEIHNRINELMKNENLSQQGFADKLGIPRSNVNNWTRGANNLKADDIAKISKTFGVSADWLIGLTDIENTSNDETVKMVSNYTGLSSKAVECLHRSYKKYDILLQDCKNRAKNPSSDDFPKVINHSVYKGVNALLENALYGHNVLSSIYYYVMGKLDCISVPYQKDTPEDGNNGLDMYDENVENDFENCATNSVAYLRTQNPTFYDNMSLMLSMEGLQQLLLVNIQGYLSKLRDKVNSNKEESRES